MMESEILARKWLSANVSCCGMGYQICRFTLKHVPTDFHYPLFFHLLINQEIEKF